MGGERMKVILSVELCEKVAYAGKREVLFKSAVWDAIPVEGTGTVMQFGQSAQGETGIVSANEFHVYWDTTGVVNIGMRIENLGDEFEDIMQCAMREGFAHWVAWKKEWDES